MPAEIHKNPSSNSLEEKPVVQETKIKQGRASHKRFASNVDSKGVASFKQQPSTSFKECRSATNLDCQPFKNKLVEITTPTHKRMLSQTHSIDPITQDMERRMSMKDHHSTLGSSSRSDENASRDQSFHSLHNSFDHAKAVFKSYGTSASVFIRGAYAKARNIVASRCAKKWINSFFLVLHRNAVRWLAKTMKD